MPVSIPSNNASFTSGVTVGPVVPDLAFASVGDLIVIDIWIYSGNTPTPSNIPAGWTLNGSRVNISGGASWRLANFQYSRIRQAGDSNSPSFVFNNNTQGWCTHSVGYRSTVGFDANSCYGYATTEAGNAVRQLAAPAVTNVAGEMCGSGSCGKLTDSNTGISGSNWTILSNRLFLVNTSDNAVELAAYRTAAGANTLTYTFSGVTTGMQISIANVIQVRDGVKATTPLLMCEV